MSTRVQWRRGNTAQTATFTGAVAEITVDTDKNVVVVHDGVTAGGHPAPTIEFTQAAFNKANAGFEAVNTLSQSALTNGDYTFSLNSDGSVTLPTMVGGDATARLQAASYKDIELNAGGSIFTVGYDNTLKFPDGSKQSTAYKESVYVQANVAFDKANSGYILAQGAFDAANNVAPQIEPSFSKANAAFNTANSAGVYANSAFGYANSAFGYANSAFGYANSAYTQANSAYSAAQAANDYAGVADVLAQGAFNKANSGTIIAQGAYDTANLKFNTSGGTITGDVTINGQANVNSRLAVGTGAYTILPNLIAQFTGTSNYYSQINQQNLSGNGSGDIVITADNGTDQVNYIDLGICGSTYDNTTPNAFITSNPNDGYLYLVGNTAANFGGNLFIGTAGSGYFSDIIFVQGSSYEEVGRFKTGQGLLVNQNLQANNFTTNQYIDFVGQSSNPSSGEGRVWYSNGDHGIKMFTETGVAVDLNKQSVIRVYNNTGSTIGKGKAVRATGGESVDTTYIALAQADTYGHCDALIGITAESIANASYGYVVTSGPLTGIDTSGVVAGAITYLSNSVGGGFTNADYTPAQGFPVHLGTCLVSDATNGVILVSLKGIEWGANFTNGAVAYSNGYRLYQDPTYFFYDQTNHRLGIGTDTPTDTLTIIGDAHFGGNVVITGNLTAANFQSVSTSTLTVSGNTIILNDGTTGAPSSNATILVNRGSSPNVYITWNENLDEWVTFDGTNEGHLLNSAKTFTDWNTYGSAVTYEKASYPIGAGLANATNELAKTANTIAYSAQSSALAADNKAQLAFDKANTGGVQSITANSSGRITQSSTTGAVTFDLATTGVSAGTYTYPSIQVDVYGRTVSISNQTPVTSWNGMTGAVTLSSANVVSALTYTPVNKAGDVMSGTLQASGLTSNTSVTINTSGVVTTNTYTTGASTSQVTVDTFASTTYRSAKYLVQMTAGTSYHAIELRVLHDGTTVWLSQYGEMFTGSSLGTFDASITTGVLSLLFTPASATATTVKVVRTVIVV